MLTTLETVKQQLGVDSSDTSMDAQISRVIKAVSAAIETICKRTFEESSHTQRFEPSNKKNLYPNNWPIISVQSVTFEDEVLTADEYEIYENKIIKEEGLWDKESKVEYTAGYKLPGDENRNLPYDIEDAAILYATIRIRSIANAGIKSEQVDVLRVQYEDTYGGKSAPTAVISLLEPYMRRTA